MRPKTVYSPFIANLSEVIPCGMAGAGNETLYRCPLIATAPLAPKGECMMAVKKQLDAKEIVLEMYGKARQGASFKNLSDSEYIGYVTAMVQYQNLRVGYSLSEWMSVVKELFIEGKL